MDTLQEKWVLEKEVLEKDLEVYLKSRQGSFRTDKFPGTLVLELDWLPVRTDKNDPLVLCIAGADSSFRLIQVNMYASHLTKLAEQLALFSCQN
ncbi:hypothetical protein Ccrd_001250, partial [Cynara cardunculus var. scolymus]